MREAEERQARAAAEQAERKRLADEKLALSTAYRAHVDTPEQQRIMKIVYKLAPRFGLEPGLVYAVIRAESNFNPQAVSIKNAQGLMQDFNPAAQQIFGYSRDEVLMLIDVVVTRYQDSMLEEHERMAARDRQFLEQRIAIQAAGRQQGRV